MIIGNVVKEVLSYRKGQLEKKLSSPKAFMSSSFGVALQNETAKEVKMDKKLSQVRESRNVATEMDVKNAEPLQVAQQEFSRRFSDVTNTDMDTWELTQKYNIQNIRSKNEGKYADIIQKASNTYGIPKTLIQKMIEVESDYNPNTVSSAGAMGLMQLMPDNVKEQGVKNPFSPAESIEGGVKELTGYLKKYNGDLVLALAAYNAGPGNVKKYGGVPPFQETEKYIKKILNVDVSK
ncbi:lytic transglycosylase domain-containing protein [Bacillus sp. WLY-B-L8]|uniref:lytic transglycosylase domain-containing protein n=1 Tax=Bacillus multifaciens TaxID=3068506 RepID=UPI0027403BA9|nr:lytic transglycosylase domain-containing protein [Bacillus sp. WLY-B-L8]MDP7981136.1 lytic transglycosylase domain-containing protein [Bacillus sp. WLY-B-L8]